MTLYRYYLRTRYPQVAFLVLNLFIGIVTTEMADAKEEAAQRRKVESKLALATRLRMRSKKFRKKG